MKKILPVLALVLLVSSCTVIDPNYTGPRVVTQARSDYDYYPSYGYYGTYYSPYMWSGWYGWWNPFWLYGYYNPYGRYNPYFWAWYSTGYRSGYSGTSVITKRQLSKPSTRTLSPGTIRRGTTGSTRSGGTRTTVIRSGSSSSRSSGTRTTVSRSGSSRSSSSSARTTSSGSRTVKRVKK